jgi:DNA-binding response OmpR family regulator
VDDEESILPVIIGFLETTDLDLKIESTTNGYDACIKFGSFAPDLVILDIVMRGFDGIEVLKKIQENPHKNMAKILVMSGHSQYMDEAMQLGADDFLPKPFKANELIKKVTDLLGGKGKSECPLEYSFDKVHHLIEKKEGRDV